jgi:hypothetical protein
MNNLTPELRPDINGKVTTRWVRKGAQGTSKALLAAPPVIASNTLPPFTDETAPLTALAMDGVFASGRPCEVSDLNPLTVQKIEGLLQEEKDYSLASYLVAEGNLLKVLYEARDNTRKWGGSEKSILLNDISVLTLRVGLNPKHVVAGLRTYPEFKDVDDFLYGMDEGGQEKARALYTVISSIDSRYRDEYFLDEDDYEETAPTWQEEDTQYIRLKNPDLAKFVLDNPKMCDDIIRVVKERRTDDVTLIRSVLMGEAQALGEGNL